MMASWTWYTTVVLYLCLTLVAQKSSSVLSTNEVTLTPGIVKTYIGSSVELQCSTPNNTSVLWFRDDKPLAINSQELVLSDIGLNDNGIYKCCAAECTAGNFATAAINVGEGPRQPLNLHCECRDIVNVNCSWDMEDPGDMQANVSIYISPIEDFSINMQWTIPECRESNPSPRDKKQFCLTNPNTLGFGHQTQYAYKVFSSNNFGELVSNEIHFSASRHAIPYPPDKVEVWAESSEIISVKWFAPPKWPVTQVSNIDFQIELSEKKTDEWVVAEIEKIKTHVGVESSKIITLGSLKPFREYCVRISSRRVTAAPGIPYSETSDPVCTRTFEIAPGPPFGVKYEILSPPEEDKETRTVRISWQPVPLESRNGIILGYRIVLVGVHAKDQTNTTKIEQNVTSTETSVTIAGLDNYRTYTITIQAFNSAGMSWEKAMPDGPIQALDESTAVPVPRIAVALIVPIAVICLAFMMYCIWHRGKKILKPTYDIQIPERARNENLYVSTVNFRMQESECFDELKAPPENGLVVNLPSNGVYNYGNGNCPTSDYSEDPCTPGLPSSENFPLLSGHMMDANNAARESQDANKMLTVDCGEGKALLDAHPYHDVGYNQTGSPLSVASGGSYWTTGGDENESVSYHRMSPKGLAVCDQDGDDRYPSPPDSPSAHASYSMMGAETTQNSAPPSVNPNTSSSNLPKSPTSPSSPTSPIGQYSMHASASAITDTGRRGEHSSLSSEDDVEGGISSYVQQTTLGLLLPVPQIAQNAQNLKGKKEEAKENVNNVHPHRGKDDSVDAESIDSEEDVDGALDSYVRTGTNRLPQSPVTTGTSPNPMVDNYVKASHDNGHDLNTRGTAHDLDTRVTAPRGVRRVRSASGSALDTMRRTHVSTPDFMDDSDSAISMEDADLQYVQAGCADNVFGNATPKTIPTSPVLPGVAIDFPSDGSEDIPHPSNSLAPGSKENNSLTSGDPKLSDNDLSDVEYERYNDDAIDGYVTHGRALDTDDEESCPMLPYVAIDLAQVPNRSPISRFPPVGLGSSRRSTQPNGTDSAQPFGMDSGYVPQAHVINSTKEGGSVPTSPCEKSAYDNPEYGVLAQCLSEIEQNKKRQENPDYPNVDKADDEHGSLENNALVTTSNENLTTNNNSPYVPHGKAPLRQNIERLEEPSGVDQGYLPHGSIPSPQNVSEVNGTCAHGVTLPVGTGDRGYIPIKNIPAV